MTDQPDNQTPPPPPRDESTAFITRADGSVTPDIIYSRFLAQHMPFGFQRRDDQELAFHPMPYRPDPDDGLLLAEPWRVMLELYEDDQRRVLGLELYGDVMLGRGQSRPGSILLNLEPYNAQELGVSREHALLRPSKANLFVIDQGSTNGTTVNGTPVGRGVATPLRHEDLLRLGNLVLMVHILARPSRAG